MRTIISFNAYVPKYISPCCILNPNVDRSRYCRNYPESMPPYRLHRETGRCYQVGESGPCPPLMKFTLEDDTFGVCDCDLSQRCGRPLIFWPSRNRCYRVYEQVHTYLENLLCIAVLDETLRNKI